MPLPSLLYALCVARQTLGVQALACGAKVRHGRGFAIGGVENWVRTVSVYGVTHRANYPVVLILPHAFPSLNGRWAWWLRGSA